MCVCRKGYQSSSVRSYTGPVQCNSCTVVVTHTNTDSDITTHSTHTATAKNTPANACMCVCVLSICTRTFVCAQLAHAIITHAASVFPRFRGLERGERDRHERYIHGACAAIALRVECTVVCAVCAIACQRRVCVVKSRACVQCK